MSQSQKIVTVEDQLKLMRQGYKAELKLTYGGLELPCRLLSATEEASLISNAKANTKVPAGHDTQLMVSMAVMKAVLAACCTVDSTPHASRPFLDAISSTELESLYDQYLTHKEMMNPDFESLGDEKIVEFLLAVKKKEKTSGDFYTWQLAAIGKFYLDRILPTVNAAGS